MKSDRATADVSNGQRALWTFLLATLVAPFLAAVLIFAASVIAGLVGRGPASLLALDRGGQVAWAADKAVSAYVWSAIPAGVGGAAMAAFVFKTGAAPWLGGAVVGAVSVSVLAVLAGGVILQHLAPIAFIAALVGAGLCRGLAAAGIVK